MFISRVKCALFFFGIILVAFAKLRKVTTGFITSACLSVHPSAWNNSAPNRRIFVKLVSDDFFRKKSSHKIQVSLNCEMNKGYEDHCKFMVISQSFLQNEKCFRKTVVEKIKTYSLLWIRKTNQMSLFVFFISLLIVAQHVSGNHVPIISS